MKIVTLTLQKYLAHLQTYVAFKCLIKASVALLQISLSRCNQPSGKTKWRGNWCGLPTQIHVHTHQHKSTYIYIENSLHIILYMDYVYLVVIRNIHYQFLQFIGRALTIPIEVNLDILFPNYYKF